MVANAINTFQSYYLKNYGLKSIFSWIVNTYHRQKNIQFEWVSRNIPYC